jgi:hypothetical protein
MKKNDKGNARAMSRQMLSILAYYSNLLSHKYYCSEGAKSCLFELIAMGSNEHQDLTQALPQAVIELLLIL